MHKKERQHPCAGFTLVLGHSKTYYVPAYLLRGYLTNYIYVNIKLVFFELETEIYPAYFSARVVWKPR